METSYIQLRKGSNPPLLLDHPYSLANLQQKLFNPKMSGLGNFLNPNKLLSKDKKASTSTKKPPTQQQIRTVPTFSNVSDVQYVRSKLEDDFDEGAGYESVRTKSRYTEEKEPREKQHRRRPSNEELLEEQEEMFRRNKYGREKEEVRQPVVPAIPISKYKPRPVESQQEQQQDLPQQSIYPTPRSNRSSPKGTPQQLAHQKLSDLSLSLKQQQSILKKSQQQFTLKLRHYINQQFNKFREAIRQTVQIIFQQSEQQFKRAFEQEHSETLNQFAMVNDRLNELQGRIEEMMEELEGSGWRAVVRRIDSREFEAEVEEAMGVPREEVGKAVLQIDQDKVDQFGEALERLMKVKLVKKKDHRRKPNV